MKKTSIFVVTALALVMGLASCSSPAGSDEPGASAPHVAEIVDLRNYKGNQVSFLPASGGDRSARSARAAASDPNKTFSYSFVSVVPRFIGENGVETNKPSFVAIGSGETAVTKFDGDTGFDVFKNAVVIEDNENGIKFTFNRPDGYETSKFTWINVQFLDKVGHKSTGISLVNEKLTDTNADPKVELIYPLVDPDTTEETRFWIQYKTADFYADVTYKVDPIHGEGCVKAVQPDYKITDYLELSEEGVMTLKLTLPPVAKDGTLKHNITLHAQSGSGPAYSAGAGEPSDVTNLCKYELATTEEVNASKQGTVYEYTVDFKALYNSLSQAQKDAVDTTLSTKPYIWASLTYSYEIPVTGFENFVFDTPWVISNVVANPFATSSND